MHCIYACAQDDPSDTIAFFLAGGFMKGYFSKVGVSTAFSLPSGSYRGSRRQDTQSSAYHKFKFDENPVTDNR